MSNNKGLLISLGIMDDVDSCEQPVLTIDLLNENLAVFGNKFSGKTTFLKHIILELHADKGANERIVILDFSNGLREYHELPLVYGYFSGENEESIKRCLSEIENSLYGNKSTNLDRPHYTFIVDGLDDLFLDGKYERHQETFISIVKKGLENRIAIVFTSYHSTNSIIRLLQFFEKTIAFDLPVEKYEDLFPKKVDKPIAVQGRGIANRGDKAYEFQAYFPFHDKNDFETEEKEHLNELANASFDNDLKDKRKKSFSSELTEKEFERLFPEFKKQEFVIGVDYTKFNPVIADLSEAGVIAFYGSNFEDKLTQIRRIIKHTASQRVIVWDDSRDRLINMLSDLSIEQVCSIEEFKEMFAEEMYEDVTDREEISKKPNKTLQRANVFTVFIIQNSHFFSKTPGGEGTQLSMRMCPLLQTAAESNYLFIFTNISPFPPGSSLRDHFNSYIKHAFLFGDIFHFIETRGRSSAFGELDPYELKQDFSRTIVGDGFYMDNESDYPQKIKFVI